MKIYRSKVKKLHGTNYSEIYPKAYNCYKKKFFGAILASYKAKAEFERFEQMDDISISISNKRKQTFRQFVIYKSRPKAYLHLNYIKFKAY